MGQAERRPIDEFHRPTFPRPPRYGLFALALLPDALSTVLRHALDEQLDLLRLPSEVAAGAVAGLLRRQLGGRLLADAGKLVTPGPGDRRRVQPAGSLLLEVHAARLADA